MSTTDMTEFEPVEETSIVAVEVGAVAALNKSEVEAQIDAAHKYKRSINRFRQAALTMATVSEEVAQSCIYSLPRGGKPIAGPSVRLAEICASAWGNIHVGARPVEVGETEVTSQGVAWDLETNYRATVESKRRITDRNGRRFNDDMIIMTQNAANSIALRNAIFRVIPRAYVDQIYAKVREVAVGNAATLAGKRASLMDRLGKMGVDQARVLAAIGKTGVDDIGLEEMETLIGYGTAIKEGTKTVDELFPAPTKDVPGTAQGEQGKRIKLGAKRDEFYGKKDEAPKADPEDSLPVTEDMLKEIASAAKSKSIHVDDAARWLGKASAADLTRAEAKFALKRIAETPNP